MKNPDRETVSRLVDLPNIGKAIAVDLQLIGINHPRKLIGKDPFKLYEELCTTSEKRHDPCVIDVFMSAVHFMEGGDPLPWWSFTDERKKQITQREITHSGSSGPPSDKCRIWSSICYPKRSFVATHLTIKPSFADFINAILHFF